MSSRSRRRTTAFFALPIPRRCFSTCCLLLFYATILQQHTCKSQTIIIPSGVSAPFEHQLHNSTTQHGRGDAITPPDDSLISGLATNQQQNNRIVPSAVVGAAVAAITPAVDEDPLSTVIVTNNLADLNAAQTMAQQGAAASQSPSTEASTVTMPVTTANPTVAVTSTTTVIPPSNVLFNVPTTIRPVNASATENRLRWVNAGGDFRRPQAYPPMMPHVPGIPSGFRNPLVTSTPTPPTSSSTPSTTIATVFNPGTHHDFFGGSSSNPINFGGAVILDEDPPFKLSGANRRYNITRVEHITAECSDEYMKVVIRFNGTFTGLIYSSGYVHDPSCIYVNGSGRSYYEFFIRLNQCGTLGRQEMYHPTMPGEARRRDQLMWNTLSIQYNALIEEEFDEHFRLTCEYGSDFWKTVSFPSVGVEVNTGSPVVFTINPPQCQMEIRRGFGIAGTRTAGPVTVGDPLTLLIHMKSEKAGFDILVKNCVAHNGAQQRMQLIDSNGCVTNEKLISPFRGTYNSENGHQVSLYSYLKAFRFTGSPALYLECDIHMCHNRCPPQRCYWRNLSKRSADLSEYEQSVNETAKPVLSESISLFQALEVYHDQDQSDKEKPEQRSSRSDDKSSIDENLICLRSTGIFMMMGAFVTLMFLSIGTSICYCLRMRRVRYFQQNLIQTARHFGSSGSSSYRSRSPEYSGFTPSVVSCGSASPDYGWLNAAKSRR